MEPSWPDDVVELILSDAMWLTRGLAAAAMIVRRQLGREKWRYLYIYEVLKAILRHSEFAVGSGPTLALVEDLGFEQDLQHAQIGGARP